MKKRRKQLLALLLVFSLLTPQSVMAQDMQLYAKTAEVTETESALEKDGDETKEPSAEESPQEPVASPSEEPTEEVQEPQLPEEMPPSEEEETPDTAPAAESETDGSSQENFILEQETAATGEAALKKGWIQEEGKIRYYNEDGSYTRNNFQKIGSRSYYFDKDGYLVTGWLVKGNDTYYLKQTGEFGVKGCLLKGWQNIGKYRYHFDSSGVMTLGWITSGGKTYYMKKTGEDGIRGHMLKGWQNIGKYRYYLGTDGQMHLGWITSGGKTYFLKRTGEDAIRGHMLKSWQNIDGKTYYFGSTGAMSTGWQKIGKYYFYFKATGDFGLKGQMFTGLKRVSGKTYYFKMTGDPGVKGARFTNYTYTVNGKTYHFGSDGVGVEITGGYVYATDPENGKSYKLESEFYTDPQIGNGANQVTQTEFLAAVLYTEAGDQGVAGQTMVATVIYNRMMSSSFPDSMNFVVYAAQQFEVARNGRLTELLEGIRDNDAESLRKINQYGSMEAAKTATQIYEDYRDGKVSKRIIPNVSALKNKDFSYLYFMTHKAFENLGLDEKKCDVFKYDDHIFFKNWVK